MNRTDDAAREPVEEAPPSATGLLRAEGEAPSATGLLRAALVNEDDPRFPWWLPLPGLALALLWAGYRAATVAAGGDGSSLGALLEALLWPGAAIFVLTSAAAWFGWQLEID